MTIDEKWILGIRLRDRIHEASALQDVLTKFGCSIRTRLGVHETGDQTDSESSIILLELTGDPYEFVKLENELLKLPHAEVRKMVFGR